MNQIQHLHHQKIQYAQSEHWQQAALTETKHRKLILQSIPFILPDLKQITPPLKKSLISWIRNFPDEDYLKAIEQLAKHANLKDTAQNQFLENIIFEPFEGERDNLLAMNWRDQNIRNMCLQLEKKLPPQSPHRKTISGILNGRQFDNMISNALAHQELRIPTRLSRNNYSPQFLQWGKTEQEQAAAIQELRQAWDKACDALLSMKGPEDIVQINRAWEHAAQQATIVMEMLPPDTEEAQQRLGKLFYEVAFCQYSSWFSMAGTKDSKYPLILEKLIELNKTDEKLLLQLQAFGHFQAAISNSKSYLNEEALLLLTEESRKKIRQRQLPFTPDQK